MVAGGAMVGSLFSADAWNNVTYTAGEVKNPRRNLPLSLILGRRLRDRSLPAGQSGLPGGLAAGGQSRTATTPFERGISHARDDRVGTAVLELVSPRFGVPLMALAIMVSSFGCLNGLILMGARLYYAMARDGALLCLVGRAQSARRAGRWAWCCKAAGRAC